jgi:hypothetical protein
VHASVERYLRLGLRVGRHVEGIVDAYFGPAGLAAAVEAEPLAEPAALAADADALLDELEDGWLRDQMVGLRTYVGVLAGETLPYADEVEGCFGVRPTHTDESVFEEAHELLADALPGAGPLGERHARWEESIRVPCERIERIVTAVIGQARELTRGLVTLPADEGVAVELVRDVPWLAFCEYLGDLRSRISVNVDLPMSALELLVLAVHETYPGHHTERCSKEQRLVRERGLVEETLVLVPTPQSHVSEGIATLAPSLLLEGEGGPALAAILRAEGIELDVDQALAVARARAPLRWAEVNAALMLHAGGAAADDVRAYLERWGLMPPELAAHMLRFFGEPTSRTYVVTYAAGLELCGAYVAGEPGRFGRLLTEQVRLRDLLDAG